MEEECSRGKWSLVKEHLPIRLNIPHRPVCLTSYPCLAFFVRPSMLHTSRPSCTTTGNPWVTKKVMALHRCLNLHSLFAAVFYVIFWFTSPFWLNENLSEWMNKSRLRIRILGCCYCHQVVRLPVVAGYSGRESCWGFLGMQVSCGVRY